MSGEAFNDWYEDQNIEELFEVYLESDKGWKAVIEFLSDKPELITSTAIPSIMTQFLDIKANEEFRSWAYYHFCDIGPDDDGRGER